jgi:hypothetical protein
MGNGDIHPWTPGQEQVMHSIASSLRVIANCMEAQEKRERTPRFQLGSEEHWKYEVAEGRAINGYAEWKAWYESDQLERQGEAIAAVRRGFASLEAQMREEPDDPGS